MRFGLSVVLAVICLAASQHSAIGQCEPMWRAGEGFPGVGGSVLSMANLPDGRVVVGGQFQYAGNTTSSRVAIYDPSRGRWSSIARPSSVSLSTVESLCVLENGEVLIGGSVSQSISAGVSSHGLLKWNSTTGTWTSFAQGLRYTNPLYSTTSGRATSIAPLSGGRLVVCGNFDTAGDTPAPGIALWNGTDWESVGDAVTKGMQVAKGSNDVVYILGTFGAPAPQGSTLARWDTRSNTWQFLGNNGRYLNYARLFVLGDGSVAVGGNDSYGALSVWSPATGSWSELGDELRGPRPLASLNGELIALGWLQTDSGESIGLRISRWSAADSHWLPLGGTIAGDHSGVSTALVTSQNQLLLGGSFKDIGGEVFNSLAEWNGATWSHRGSIPNDAVNFLAQAPGGTIIACGSFTSAGRVTAHGIAELNTDRDEWRSLSNGLWSSRGSNPLMVAGAFAESDGDVVAWGQFSVDFTVSTFEWNIARRDATTGVWTALSDPLDKQVLCAAMAHNGDLLIGGNFESINGAAANSVARWDPLLRRWQRLGAGLNGAVTSLLVLPDGRLLAGGSFTMTGVTPAARIAIWNPATQAWAQIRATLNGSVTRLIPMPDGRVLVVGMFSFVGNVSSNRIALLDPLTGLYAPIGSTLPLTSYSSLPLIADVASDGTIVVGNARYNSGSTSMQLYARDSGTGVWMILPGQSLPYFPDASFKSIVLTEQGDVFAAGGFTSIGTQLQRYIVRRTSQPRCSTDFDCSDAVETSDLFSFLSAWLSTLGQTGSNVPTDFTHDQVVTMDDLFEFISAWFDQNGAC